MAILSPSIIGKAEFSSFSGMSFGEVFHPWIILLLGTSLGLSIFWVTRKTRNPPAPLSRLGKVLYAGILAATLVLGLTGIVPILLNDRVHGWTLIAHCAAAPVYSISLAGFGLFAANRYACSFAPGATCASPGCRIASWLFWPAMIAGLGVLLSGVLPMFPLFSTPWQQWAMQCHRVFGLLFVALIMPHAARVFRGA